MSTLQQRSHGGCWTCKRRRRKCGEERPLCRLCTEGGFECEGYAPRLRWGVGVASRGILTGAKDPIRDKAPPRQRGRQRDIARSQKSRKGPSAHQSPVESTSPLSSATSMSPQESNLRHQQSLKSSLEEQLFNEFLLTGHLLLYSTKVADDPLLPMIPRLCDESRALYSICVAFQAYITDGHQEAFLDYYDQALSSFRADLNHPVRQLGNAVLIAGLLLCTIGILQGTKWTTLLTGLEKLLELRGLGTLDASLVVSPDVTQAIEVFGLMDLPLFVIGQEHPSMRIWYRYRSQHLLTHEPDSVEPTSGLPRTLLDIFSGDGDGEVTDEALWLWPGCEGEVLQCHLWEAYRCCGMLDVRRRRLTKAARGSPGTGRRSFTSQNRSFSIPTNAILVSRAVSSLDAMYTGAETRGDSQTLVMNALLYPLFTLGLEVLQSESHQPKHSMINSWFQTHIEREKWPGTKLVYDILQETCVRSLQEGLPVNPDEVAMSMGVEAALF